MIRCIQPATEETAGRRPVVTVTHACGHPGESYLPIDAPSLQARCLRIARAQVCPVCARVRRFTLLRFPVPPALQAEYDALPAPVPVPTDALLDALVARERLR